MDEPALRQWLIDYVITDIGCEPDAVNLDGSLADQGVGSRDAVVLAGELAELLGRPVSPVELWQYPSINALVASLLTPDSDDQFRAGDAPERHWTDEPIAVLGMGCRLPGGIAGPEALWRFLGEGGSAVGQVPPERWQPFDDGSDEFAAALSSTTRWGAFLSGIEDFDADFFDISAREAAKMDPQQRLLLQVAWESLEHAGIRPSSLRRSQTGVFVGACVSEYGYLGSTDLPSVDAWSNTGGALSIIANRLSYFLDLRGPSLAVDTACSSSLVALHLACQNLRSRECDVALAAGVNLLLSPAVFHGFDQAGVLSPSGRCHAFDAGADGFVRGEGCGVVVLKRLSDALRDGDPVLAIIRGSAVNQDGRSNGLMAPNPGAQIAVLRAAYANAGVSPHEVDYVEAHGTGTLLGDPIEARALGTVLGRGRREPLLIGSIKSNLGHLEAAAGVVGFLKAVLAVRHAEIPASLNYENPNPHIPFDQLRLEVTAQQQQWPQTRRPRRVGVSSFGFGGTNAHMVIEEAPVGAPPDVGDEALGRPVETLIVSAKTPPRVAAAAGSLARWLADDGADVSLAGLAHTLNHHRDVQDCFATVTARDLAGAAAGLQALAEGRSADGVAGPHHDLRGTGTVFVYSGQGSQWTGMGRRLLGEEPVFAAAIDRLEPDFVEQVGFSLRALLADGGAVRGDAQVQPAIMGLQLALTALWRAEGVEPDAVIGHSMGEVTAAVVADALSVREGLRVIAARSRLMARLAGQGAVALIRLDAEATEALIADHPGVTVAVYSSPSQTVIAGPADAVEAALSAAHGQGIFARRVNMEVASHTALMDPILPELRAALADLQPRAPRIRFISTIDDPSATAHLDADYWVANLRRPVLLSRAISAAADQYATFVEISPHPTLAQSIVDTIGDAAAHRCVTTLMRDGDDTVQNRTAINAVRTRPPDTPHPPEPHPALPTTPWQPSRHWLTVRPIRRGTAGVPTGEAVIPDNWSYELTWPARPLVSFAGSDDGRWLVIGDPEIAAELERVAGDHGTVTVATDTDTADLASMIAGATQVLFAPAAIPAWPDAAAGYRLFHTARRLVAAMAATDAAPPRLIVLTRNAQPVSAGDRCDPAHAVLWGLARTVALEHPELFGAVIDVDATVPAGVAIRYVLAEAGSDDGEDQVVYRAGNRFAPRLRPAVAPAAVRTDTGGAHLVVGATGNVGPHLIRQLAAEGATTVVALSRRPGTALDDVTREAASTGTTVVTVAADATDEGAMTELFDRFGADLPPLSAVYLAAFGGGPVTLQDMTDRDVEAMFRPKLDAAELLHRLSLRQPVRRFVMFSSISGLLGSRWLGHYAATTTFLDALAYARRAAGLPATTVDWGLWQSLAEGQDDLQRQVTVESGLRAMPDEIAIAAMTPSSLSTAPARAVIVSADWPQLAAAYRTRAALRIVDDLIDTADAGASAGQALTHFRTELQACEAAQRRSMVTEHVAALVTKAMGLASVQLLNRSAGFFQLGMDSLTSVTLQRSLSESLGESLPSSVIFDYPTVAKLAHYVCTLLPEVDAIAVDDHDTYADLTEDELLKQLSERLG